MPKVWLQILIDHDYLDKRGRVPSDNADRLKQLMKRAFKEMFEKYDNVEKHSMTKCFLPIPDNEEFFQRAKKKIYRNPLWRTLLAATIAECAENGE